MNERFTVLKTDAEIRERILALAADISKDYQHITPDNPLLVLCTLRGAVFFSADLVRALTVPCEINFIKVQSYAGTRPAGSPIFELGERIDVRGREVLIVEDIVDTGQTMDTVMHNFSDKGAAGIRIATMLDKPSRRYEHLKETVIPDYIGFSIPDLFVVGFGLDYNEKYRMLPDDIGDWYVRAADGQMVPFSAFSSSRWEYGSPRLERYNGLPSMEILGQAAPGKSTGEAMELMEQLASKLPTGVGYDWTGMSYQERLSGNQAPSLYAISLIVVFLCLAALYESWSIPFSVMLVVPLGVIGALLAATFRGLTNDVYFQVGLLTTIGLSAKNAILIVEFAKDLMDKEGKGLIEATLDAVRMRLRPILMTSLAFILGVMPLVISTGAGSGAQNAVGTGVMGGMVTATVLAIFFVPVFFVVVRRRFSRKNEDIEHSHTVDHH